jgi:hypothetical protein
METMDIIDLLTNKIKYIIAESNQQGAETRHHVDIGDLLQHIQIVANKICHR